MTQPVVIGVMLFQSDAIKSYGTIRVDLLPQGLQISVGGAIVWQSWVKK